MAVYKDDRGTWRYRKLVSGERISGTPEENTRSAAEEAERLHVGRVREGTGAHALTGLQAKAFSAAERVTFAEHAKKWVETYPATEGLKKSTITHRLTHIDTHLLAYFGDMLLAEITAERLREFIAYMLDKPHGKESNTDAWHKARAAGDLTPWPGKRLTRQTVKHVRNTLHKLLVVAHEWGKIPAVPKFPKLKVPRAEWDFLRFEESKALLEAAKASDMDYARLCFAAKTGCRVGEQIGLQWEDIDFPGNKITIRRAEYRGVIQETKTSKTRVIPLAPVLKEALSNLPRNGAFVFPGYTRKAYEHLLRKTLKAAGIKRKLSWHDLRHTFASHLIMRNISVPQVQQWLGHGTITMTMRYAHLAPDHGHHQIALLDN